MRRALPFLVVLVLVGPALVQRPSVVVQVPTVRAEGVEVRPRRAELTARCFGFQRRPRPRCDRIHERRGGVETRLGTMEIPPR